MSDAWSTLRLRDRIAPGLRVLFVGINPGVRSAQTGHNFAGPSNRFWKLFHESGLVDRPVNHEDDDRLLEQGFGFTNLVPRPSPGIDDLKPAEYLAGWAALDRKIKRYRPTTVALVGVTLYRVIRPLLEDPGPSRPVRVGDELIGLRPETIHGARIFVLPNPSGRNAHFSYTEMLNAFRKLKRLM